VSDSDVRADRHALLELDGLLARIELLTRGVDRDRFNADEQFRWVLHRLWIAVGNEALAYAVFAGLNPGTDQPWARLYNIRNKLAHRRLPDVDEDEVWRITVLRPEPLRRAVRDLLR
jgi:uncharacterized protein with HEPN domain